MNIQFQYLYRGGGNYKNLGKVIFGNQGNLAAKEINERVLRAATNEPFFRASALGLPDLFFENFHYDPELDHKLHEYDGVSETVDSPDDLQRRDIAEFLSVVDNEMRDWSG